VLQQLTQLGRTDSAVGAPVDFTMVQKYDFFAQCLVYVFYVYVPDAIKKCWHFSIQCCLAGWSNFLFKLGQSVHPRPPPFQNGQVNKNLIVPS